MSEQEQDAIVGRLIREKSQAMRQKAALDAELKRIEAVLNDVFRRLHLLGHDEINDLLEPIQQYFNIKAFLGLLRERDEVQAKVIERVKTLREMGAIDD